MNPAMPLTIIARLRLALPGYPDREHLVVERAHRSLSVMAMPELEQHLWSLHGVAQARVHGLGPLRLVLDGSAPLGIAAWSARGEQVDNWLGRLPELQSAPAVTGFDALPAPHPLLHAR